MVARVLVSDDLSPEGVEILKAAGLQVDVKLGLKPDALEQIIPEYDGLAVRSATKVTARLLERATRLKVIGRAGVGVDNVDIEAATRRGVVVMNTPGGSSTTVAELTLAHMVALARHVAQATASVKGGKWEKKKFQGRELAGKTLGVVGIGNIGSIVVERCQAMKMRVIAYDPFIAAEAAAKLGVTQVSLDELWAQADFISLHVPLTEQTRNLVNAQSLARMKKGAMLVNCARGGLIDETALADALASGHLGGAALDVFEQEPPPPGHPLLQLENFICTPHIGRLDRGGAVGGGRRDRGAARRLPHAWRGQERGEPAEHPAGSDGRRSRRTWSWRRSSAPSPRRSLPSPSPRCASSSPVSSRAAPTGRSRRRR